MSTPRKVALVVGARGIIGRHLVDHLESLGDWDIIGLSRRGGESAGRVRHLSVDLLDRDAAHRQLSSLTDVTHVFYAAYQERPTWAGLVAPNLAMLENVVEAIERASPRLRHVNLMQGYKVYGAHLGPFKTPAREDDPPHLPPEFNVDQQRFLEQRGGPWSWSALRPSVVGGIALGTPMNLAMVIGVYAAIARELRVPFRFPGKPGAYHALLELTDADLLARAAVWASTHEPAANQAFNIANGDLVRWSNLWPRLARLFDLDEAPPLPLSLDAVMADKEPLWNTLAARHQLTPTFPEVSSWRFGDAVFSWDYDMFADTTKARRLGFCDFVDTEEMFRRLFGEMRRRRILPP
jgi:nucleoside-diphosphate-sugar epimerase